MPNHTPEAVIAELATIKKDIKVEGQGNNCLPDDYAKIHYKASLASNGLKVADTRAAGLNGKSAPKIFVIGHFDNIKCLDLILPQMKQGEEADVFCPYNLAYGSTEKYSQFGSDVIPAKSDIIFNIQVLGCKPSALPGRTIIYPKRTIEAKKRIIEESKAMVEKLKAKILKLTHSLA